MTEEQLTRRREREFVLSFLRRGGALIREEMGGAVGIRWGPAHRCGTSFDSNTCERLLSRGCVINGKSRILENPHPFSKGNNVFVLLEGSRGTV